MNEILSIKCVKFMTNMKHIKLTHFLQLQQLFMEVMELTLGCLEIPHFSILNFLPLLILHYISPRALHMIFQVPSYHLAIRTGYSLFLLKIQRILSIFEAVYLILFGVKSFNRVFNDRICFPHVQTIHLTPKKLHFKS
jgi:hypothetical protein